MLGVGSSCGGSDEAIIVALVWNARMVMRKQGFKVATLSYTSLLGYIMKLPPPLATQHMCERFFLSACASLVNGGPCPESHRTLAQPYHSAGCARGTVESIWQETVHDVGKELHCHKKSTVLHCIYWYADRCLRHCCQTMRWRKRRSVRNSNCRPDE